jgi:hypothetical protein
MLRISIDSCGQNTTVKVEGRVIGAWVSELGACWADLLESAPRPIRVDLDDVSFVDAAGKSVLRRMRADGAILVATSLTMRAVVEEIGAADPTVRE